MEKKADPGGCTHPPSMDFHLIVSEVFPFECKWRREVKSPVNAVSGSYGGRLQHFLQNCSRGCVMTQNTLRAEFT